MKGLICDIMLHEVETVDVCRMFKYYCRYNILLVYFAVLSLCTCYYSIIIMEF